MFTQIATRIYWLDETYRIHAVQRYIRNTMRSKIKRRNKFRINISTNIVFFSRWPYLFQLLFIYTQESHVLKMDSNKDIQNYTHRHSQHNPKLNNVLLYCCCNSYVCSNSLYIHFYSIFYIICFVRLANFVFRNKATFRKTSEKMNCLIFLVLIVNLKQLKLKASGKIYHISNLQNFKVQIVTRFMIKTFRSVQS